MSGSPCHVAAPRRTMVEAIESLLARYRHHLVIVHAAMFVLFMLLIVGPLFLPAAPSSATPFSHFATFANYVLWGLWFPLVFLSVIATGRSWCGLLCPMGAAAEWGNRFGPQWNIPAWLRWEWLPVVSFLIVTILGQTLGVRDHPEAVAGIFGGTMVAALLTGLLFGRRRRAWCRHACPIGLLLGVFSRLGAVDLTPTRRLPGGEGYSERGVCPTMIDLSRKSESRHCIECFRCVNPEAKGGVRLRLRAPGAEVEQIRNHHANPVEVWFLFLSTGIALGGFLWLALPAWQDLRQMVGEFAIDRGWLWIGQPGPAWLMSVHPERREVFLWLDFGLIVATMLGVMAALTLVLMITTSLGAWAAGRAGASGGFRDRFVELGYQYAPVAMISLVVGLGGALFEPLRAMGLGAAGIGMAKGLFFLVGLLWSVRLGARILAARGIAPRQRALPLLPGLTGSVAVALAWWPAIFGL